MSYHATRKSTRQGRMETIRRRDARRAKYGMEKR